MQFKNILVELVEAKNIKQASGLDKNDLFIQLEVGSIKAASQVKKNAGSEAIWNETFHFWNIDSTQELTVKVFDKDLVGKDLIGCCTVELGTVFQKGTYDSWVEVLDSSKSICGSLNFKITLVG